MKSKKQARIWARLCALALIAVMLLTSAYAGGVIPPTEAEAAAETRATSYSVTFSAKKRLLNTEGEDLPLEADQFQFILYDSSTGQEVNQSNNTAEGDIPFTVTYSSGQLPKRGKSKTFSYILMEAPPTGDGASHYLYGTERYLVKVTVTSMYSVTSMYYFYSHTITYYKNGKEVSADGLLFTNETREAESTHPLDEPAHQKYIQKNMNGTYTLSLDVTGQSAAWTEYTAPPLDIILLADTSGSMDWDGGQGKKRYQHLQAAAKELAGTLLTEQNAALDADHQIQLALARFSSSGDNRYRNPECLTQGVFTASKDIFDTAVNLLSQKEYGYLGATRWDAGLSFADQLSSGRPGAKRVIIFLSDGNPTSTNEYAPTVYDAAVKIAQQMKATGTDIYSVGIADSSMEWVKPGKNASEQYGYSHKEPSEAEESGYYRCMEAFAIDLNGQTGGVASLYYSADDISQLSQLFQQIISDITHQRTYKALTITDTLSEYAEFVTDNASSIRVTNKSGDLLPAEDYQATISGKMITIYFPNKLTEGETYTVSFDIKPTQKAYDDRADNLNNPNFTGSEGYPVTGDNGTDAEENQTSSGKPGFYSNDRATLTYHVVTTTDGEDVVGEEATARDYAKPVIQVELSQIPVEKTWSDGEEKHAEDTISVSLYRDNDSETYRILTLNAGNEWAGSFSNLPSGHIYSIQEQMNDDLSNRYTSTIETDKVSLSLGDTNTGSEAQRFTITNTLKVASFTIKKVDKENPDKPLEGATFELVKAAENWEPIDQENPVAIEATGEDGKATFNDIPFGNYLLYETKAPAGYKLPKDPVRVTVKAGMVTLTIDGQTIPIPTPSGEGETSADVTIPNKENDKLPVAGGAGTLWFTGGGLALAGAAALLYFKQHRKKGEE